LVQVPEEVNSWREVTVVAGAVLCHVVPLLVSTLPVVPGATTCKAEVPLPSRTLLAVNVAAPVPPEATGNAAPSVKDPK
jgi:hypothetical protein